MRRHENPTSLRGPVVPRIPIRIANFERSSRGERARFENVDERASREQSA